MPIVTLTDTEYNIACIIGLNRKWLATERASKPNYGTPEHEARQDVVGAIGEACVSKYLNVAWLGHCARGKNNPDVGPYFVRATNRPTNRMLILHPAEVDDDRIFIQVMPTKVCVEWEVAGWLRGSEAPGLVQLTKNWFGRGDVYLIPETMLHDMAGLGELETARDR